MLEMRAECESCHAGLPPESPEAMICSYECTFCSACATGHLRDTCPNCGGELVRRPARATAPATAAVTAREPEASR